MPGCGKSGLKWSPFHLSRGRLLRSSTVLRLSGAEECLRAKQTLEEAAIVSQDYIAVVSGEPAFDLPDVVRI